MLAAERRGVEAQAEHVLIAQEDALRDVIEKLRLLLRGAFFDAFAALFFENVLGSRRALFERFAPLGLLLGTFLALFDEAAQERLGTRIVAFGGAYGKACEVVENEVVESVLELRAAMLARELFLEDREARYGMKARPLDAEAREVRAHIGEHVARVLLALGEVDGVDDEEHLVHLEGVLDAPELHEEFAVGMGKGVVVIRDEEDGVGLADEAEGEVGVTRVDGVGARRVDERDAPTREVAVVVDLDLLDEACLVLVDRVGGEVFERAVEPRARLALEHRAPLLVGAQECLLLAQVARARQHVLDERGRFRESLRLALEGREGAVQIGEQHGFVLQVDAHRAVWLLLRHGQDLLYDGGRRVRRDGQKVLAKERIRKGRLARAERAEERHEIAVPFEPLGTQGELFGEP